MQAVNKAFAALRDLGDPESMELLARHGLAPGVRPKVNLHIHLPPNFSAFQSVAQAVGLAGEQGVGVLGASNYYHYDVYSDFAEQARRHGIFPLFGLEVIALIDELLRAAVRINDPGNPGKMYICGMGITCFDQMTDEARRLIQIIRRNDSQRMVEMIGRVARLFASRGLQTHLDEPAIVDMVARRHACPRETVCLQERHVARAFQEVLFERVPAEQRKQRLREIFGAEPQTDPQDPVKVQNEIRSHLMKAGKPAFVPEAFINFDQAYRLILELGGIPCYPTLADGTIPICAYEDPVEKLTGSLKAAGIHCVELIPIRNKPAVLARYVKAMRRAGLVVTAGTEHNTLDMLPMEPTCLAGQPIDEELKEIFWEGACVVAAHQFLSLHGRCGFVDGDGRPNMKYSSDEERIKAFRSLGAAIIQRYYETNQA